MSTYDIQKQEFKGFLQSYWAKRDAFYYNDKLTPQKTRFNRYCGRHKNIRYMCGSRLKQFDIAHYKMIKHLKSRTSVPCRHELFNSSWRFGRKDAMHLRTKFIY